MNAQSGSFNFSLANGGSRSVAQGSSVSNSIAAILTGGGAKLVPFSASGLPPGTTATFTLPSCSPTCTTAVIIATSASTPPGTWTVTVSGKVSGLTRTTAFNLNVSGETDTTAPTIELTAPANGSAVSGSSVTVAAVASDDTGVAGVQFFLDGAPLGDAVGAPYSMTWDSTAIDNGPHALSAVAWDAAANFATAASVDVLVNNGAPAPTGTAVINGNAAVTNSSTVTLTLSAIGAVSPVTQMRFSNSGTAYSPADPYSPTKTWTLSPGGGTKTVYAQFMDAAGNWSLPATDTIVLDATAPVLSGVTAANIGTNTATISWTTDEPATSQVEYGAGTTFTTVTPVDGSLVTTHSLVISGLAAKTGYVYRVRSRDAAANEAVGATNSFTTLTPPDTTPPVVSGVTASNLGTTTATISWTTDEPATSQVEFGAGTTFTIVTPVDGSLVTTHSLVVSGLTAKTAYVYRVRSRDAASNEAIGATNMFTTLTPPDTTPPSVPDGVSAAATSISSVAVNWLASADDVAVAGYEVYRDGTRVAIVTSTSYSDANLSPSTTYSYAVGAFDAANNHSALSSASAATTLADQTPPSISISLPANGATVGGTVTITATARDDVGLAGVRFQVDGRDVGIEVGTAPFGTSVDTTKLADGDHVLTAIARDTSNNTAVSSPVSVTVNNRVTGVPTLIQHVTTSSNYDPTELGNNFRVHLADPALANNCIILGIRYPDAPGRTVTITDDRGNAWLSGPTVSIFGIRSRIFYVTGVVAGTRDITVTFDKALSGFQAQISEFYNVAVNFAVDGGSGTATSANPAITAGNVTTTMPGDLIYNYVTTNDFGAPITAITAGPGFTLLSADRLRGSAAQYAVQSDPGVINPAMTVTSLRGSMNSLTIALKAATAGTAPAPGIRVVHVYHGYWLGNPAKLQFPSTGNLLVLATSFGTGNSNISSIASTPSNTWTKVTLAPVSATDPQMLYAANATTGPDLEFAITASLKFVQFVMYDVTGASPVPFDGAAKATGNDLANESIFGAPQISSTGPGLIIATLPMGHGPPVNCTASGCLFDGVTYPGEPDGSTFESSDGYAHLYNATPGWTSFDWQPAALDLPSAWFALAVGFR